MAIPAFRNTIASFTLLGLAGSLCAAQQTPPKQGKPPATTGAKLYKQNCAVCHGNDGKGNGPPPANSPFTEPPPDLTAVGKRHNGEFPDAYVATVLRNGLTLPDHGTAEMPVWGVIFKSGAKSDESQVTLRITRLTGYLKSIQSK